MNERPFRNGETLWYGDDCPECNRSMTTNGRIQWCPDCEEVDPTDIQTHGEQE